MKRRPGTLSAMLQYTAFGMVLWLALDLYIVFLLWLKQPGALLPR